MARASNQPLCDHPKIGEKIDEPAPCYQLILDDFIEVLLPPTDFPTESLDPKVMDPNQYFITSGDAVQKTEQLDKDAFTYAGKVRSILYHIEAPTEAMKEFEQRCWKVAGGIRSMRHALIEARGTAIFMETEWNNGCLLCIPKNPRPRK